MKRTKLFSVLVAMIALCVGFSSCSSTGRAVWLEHLERILDIPTETTRTNDEQVSTLATEQGVVINGVRWATRNVDAPGTFVENPEDAGMFYQWNRRRAWAATGNVTGWDTTNFQEEYWEAGTDLYEEIWQWHSNNDPCPHGWRLPTPFQLQSLYNATHRWGSLSNVEGVFFGTYPNYIFLPAVGRRNRYGELQGAQGAQGAAVQSAYWGRKGVDFFPFVLTVQTPSPLPDDNWMRQEGRTHFSAVLLGMLYVYSYRAGFLVRCVAVD